MSFSSFFTTLPSLQQFLIVLCNELKNLIFPIQTNTTKFIWYNKMCFHKTKGFVFVETKKKEKVLKLPFWNYLPLVLTERADFNAPVLFQFTYQSCFLTLGRYSLLEKSTSQIYILLLKVFMFFRSTEWQRNVFFMAILFLSKCEFDPEVTKFELF